MKTIIRTICVFLLTLSARVMLWRHKPVVVAITGNVGKTSTKEIVAHMLSFYGNVRRSPKSFNSDTGIPLTIFNLPTGWSSFTKWFEIILEAWEQALFSREYPKYLVLEVGTDKPGDIKGISKWLKSDVVVVNRFSPVPVHIENFPDRQGIVEEKGYLVKTLRSHGVLVRCGDDPDVHAYEHPHKGQVLEFGYGPEVQYQVTETKLEQPRGSLKGLVVTVKRNPIRYTYRLPGIAGRHLAEAIAASLGVLEALGLDMTTLPVEPFENFVPPPGRMRILPGINKTTLIDDTYNSAPLAMEAALYALGDTKPRNRRIAVIGDMLELGSQSAAEHRRLGLLAAEKADIIVSVGIRAQLFSEAAKQAGKSESSIYHFEDSQTAASVLPGLIATGDIILIKGSQGVRMEHISKALLAFPDLAKDLLVRQEESWLKKG